MKRHRKNKSAVCETIFSMYLNVGIDLSLGPLPQTDATERQGVITVSQEILPLATPVERCVYRRPKVEALTGLKRSHIYNLMKKKEVPQCFRIGPRAVGWDSLEIHEWIDERRNQRH